MHIVITRPKEDSSNLINSLIKLGHSVTHLSVIKIEKLETKKINLQNYEALIFTSSKAIKYMNIDKFNSKIKCFCVGSVTEYAAKQAGFTNTFSSEGTVDTLIELIKRTLDNKSEKILYLSSEFISKDLDIDLIKAGYSVDRVSNYTSLPVEQIDAQILDFIKNNPPDVFFIYSTKSAKNLFNLINKYSLLNIVTHSNLMCISEKVLLVLKEIKWKKVFIFTPGEEEFLLNKIK
ncbi:uroporphyrinogen-III synthase [Pelagibacteraceae bacterium]|nr:uroporphyrinogen-III synthase [Pelagibacteraceae bacterium]